MGGGTARPRRRPAVARNTQRDLWDSDRPAYHDKAYRRHLLPPWDERWHRLARPARAALLEAAAGLSVYRQQQELRVSAPADVLAELAREGFAALTVTGIATLRPEARDFCLRVVLTRQFNLL